MPITADSQDRPEIPGYGPLDFQWVGNTAHTTAYDVTASRGPAGRPVHVRLGIALGEDLVPAFQVLGVRGTTDLNLVQDIVAAANSKPIDEVKAAFALHSRVEMDLERVVETIEDVRGGAGRATTREARERFARQEAQLVRRQERLERLKASVGEWFKAGNKQTLDDRWLAGGASDVSLIRIMGMRGVPHFVAESTGKRLETLFSDPYAPAARLGPLAIGDCHEAIEAAVAKAKEAGVPRIHYITDAHDPFGRRDAPFVPGLANGHQLVTHSLPWMVRDGKIASGDLVVAECPEPREFHMERVVFTLERLALDVPVVAFNRHFAVMGRTAAMREYLAGQALSSLDTVAESAGMAP